MNELMMDMENLEYQVATLRFRGAKGTTGTRPASWSCSRGTRRR